MSRKSIPRKAKTARRIRSLKRSSRAKKSDALAGLVAASAQALAVPLEPAWHTGVKFNLQLLLAHAARVDAFVLPDETEPAPVFRA
jgi:hypothetical protein